jgi:hypothetical protein
MKIKTSELTGPALRYCVAKAEGYTDSMINICGVSVFGLVEELLFDTDWSQGGPIIEREEMDVQGPQNGEHVELWRVWCGAWNMDGTTLLIAAMRALVASKLGKEVDVPEELLQ